MSDRDTHDAEYAEGLVREAFRADEGLPAEKAMRMYAQLRPLSERPRSARGARAWIAASAVTVLAVGAASVFAVRANAPAAVPAPVASAPATPAAPSPAPDAPRTIPALALKAVSEPADVLHFKASGDTSFGPDAGHSEEEMWFDPKTKAGRLVRKDYQGGKVRLITTTVTDGAVAEVTRQEPGGQPVVQPGDERGRWRRSFDKLSAYRNMLESKTATVTARAIKGGVEVYTIRAEVDGFGGGELAMVMEAEVRASDYLPLRFSSGFKNIESGKTVHLRSRTFSDFEHVKPSDLPTGWATPGGAAGKTAVSFDV